MNNKILLSFLLLLIPSLCFATAPSISDVDTITDDGASVTITVTNHGSKSTAAPAEWLKANIENGTSGDDFSETGFTGSGSGGSAYKPRYSNAMAYSGSQSILFEHYDAQTSCILTYNYGSTQTAMFVSAWVYHDRGDTCYNYQWKFNRVKEESDYPVTDENCIINDCWRRHSNDIQAYYSDNTNDVMLGACPSIQTFEGDWKRFEMYFERNSGAGNSDGELTYEFIGSSSVSTTTAMTHKESGGNWKYMLLGLYYGNLKDDQGDACGQTRDSNFYWDDVYIDNTRARVIIANYSTWAARFDTGAESELQIPTAWNSGDIEVTINYGGTFSNTDTVYVYVINSDGEVNASGYEVTLGSDTSAPAVSSASINGTTAQIVFNEDLDNTALTNLITGDLVFTGTTTGASDLGPCSEAPSGTLNCTAADTFVNGETVTLSSSGLTGNELCDALSNCISSISGESVTNNTPETGGAINSSATHNTNGSQVTYNANGGSIGLSE